MCIAGYFIHFSFKPQSVDLPDGSTSALRAQIYLGDVWDNRADWLHLNFFIYKMDSKIGFEISLIVAEEIRGRCASFMVLTATVPDIFGGQTNSSILVL